MNDFIEFAKHHAGLLILSAVLMYLLYRLLREPVYKKSNKINKRQWRDASKRLTDRGENLNRDVRKAITDISKAFEDNNKTGVK